MNNQRPFAAPINRRQFVTGAASGAALLGLGLGRSPALANTYAEPQLLAGQQFDLSVDYKQVNFTGREKLATVVNGSIPSPILRWKEGERVSLRVKNNLAEDSSIHWHGIILPTEMDGVPGMSFAGIKPGETFEYQFDVNQSGTYWYHSHSGFQEQKGMYGAIIIDPKEPDPVAYDRDHVVILSDWTDENPMDVYANLKKKSHYYNFQERTVGDLYKDIKKKGVTATWNDRAMWNDMRMSDRDISDVTGYIYTYLMNGFTPEQGWKALFKRGERVRLRFINAAAMTIFDVRIPGLKMTVVAADGQNVEPVTVDEFRMGVAETYDVIVEPSTEQPYTIFAQTIDRSGFTRGTLTPNLDWEADVPDMDHAPILGHRDMGMDHSGMGHAMHNMGGMDHSNHKMDHSNHKMDHSNHKMDHSNHKMDHSNHKMDHSNHKMDHSQHAKKSVIAPAGFGSKAPIVHVNSEFGPHVDMRADMPVDGIKDPGVGLRDHQARYGRRVLTYYDLRNLYSTIDKRDPEREIQLHLTGNMSRYMWSINGIPFSDAEPLRLTYGERVRIVLVNDTMMTHPMHLHGMWSELETGDPGYIPRKHTTIVQPGSTLSYLVTADAKGRWAYHCHLLYHMFGMFREVVVA